jgi:two-component system, NtrC family, sensor histidine kinase HydH
MRTSKTSPASPGESWLTAPLPCLLIDRRGRIHAANPAAATLLETEGPALAGRELQELFAPVPPLAALLRSRTSPVFGEPVEGTLARPAGAPRPVALRLQRLGAGRGGRMLAWVLDRSEVLELQRRLERSEKLSAMAIVAGKVAHEIRSPLNSIFLNSDLLQERVRRTRGPQAERLRHYCRVLEEEVERLNEIVESYLALARLADGERQETAVDDFLRRFVAEVAPENARRDIAVGTAFRARPATLRVNQRQLRRVLLNLFANSRDALKGGGAITVSTEDSPAGYRITVSDTGEGIPPEALSRLTTPFTTLKENGSGLGLFLAREILQHHGGRLEIQSIQGEGTSVILTLPYA